MSDNHHNNLTELNIRGYKSIADCRLELKNLNVFIGANGAGKSNFIGFFRFVSSILAGQLQLTVGKAGGPDAILHFGVEQTDSLGCKMRFNEKHYEFELVPAANNRLVFSRETVYLQDELSGVWTQGHFESVVDQYQSNELKNELDEVIAAMRRWQVYHFHDTSETAKVKQIHRINDNEFLRPDGANLAAFLYRIEQSRYKEYQRIVRTIRMVAPYFGDFHLRPISANVDTIELEWVEKDHDQPFKASDLSDGTLRFILLATVLLQPQVFMPIAIIIDEPELGLHPYAINVLGALIDSASQTRQLIVSTQSTDLVNQFKLEDLIVVDKTGGASTFKRLSKSDFKQWLDDYSLGELWQKNIFGGRPKK